MKQTLLLIISSLLLIIMLSLSVFMRDLLLEDEGEPQEDISKPVEFRFLNPWVQGDGLEQVLLTFNREHPDINVINESINREDYLLKLKTDMALGMEPDLFGLWPGKERDKLIQQGKVAKLNDIKADFNNPTTMINMVAWRLVQKGEDIHSLPLDLSCQGLFVHTDLFQAHGLPLPKTFDDLLEAVDVFRKAGIIPIAYNHSLEGSLLYQNIVAKLIGTNREKLYEDGKLHPAFIQGMHLMRELYEREAFPAEALLMDNYSRDNLFLNKQAAMLVQGSWFIQPANQSRYRETISLIPFPSYDSKPPSDLVVYGLGSVNLHISSRAWSDPAKKQAIMSFLIHLTTRSSIKTLSQNTGFISNIVSHGIIPFPLRIQAFNLILLADESLHPLQQTLGWTFWEENILYKFPLMLNGQLAPEEMLSPFTGVK